MDFVAPEDVYPWVRSVEAFVRDTRTNILDLKTTPIGLSELEDTERQAILHALEGSEVTEINLILDHELKKEHGSSKKKVEKLVFGLRKLTYGNFSSLKVPYRPKNIIRSLAETLLKTKIQKLNLSNCKLTADDLLTLMVVLKETPITEVDVSENYIRIDNYLSELLSHIMNSQVTSLNLSGTHIESGKKAAAILAQKLPETQLTRLHLGSMNFYRSKDICILFSNLQHTAITDLSLRGNRINFEEDNTSPLKLLGEVLGSTKLEKLDLSGNHIGDSGVNYLVPGLVSSKITRLNLSSGLIYGENNLLPSLKNTRITNLDLSFNPIDIGIDVFNPQFLADSALDTLLISSCQTRIFDPARFTSKDAGTIADAIRRSNLTYICLSDNELTKNCFNILGESLRGSKFKHIRLGTTRRGKSIDTIASLIEKTKGSAIISLDLRFNHLELKDAEALASSLANTPLLALDMRYNSIGKGVVSLAAQLKFTSIVYLNLDMNGIGDEGVTALAGCLEETQITILILDENAITSQGAVSLSLALKKSKLRHLSLERNKIEDDGLETLAEHAENTCITCLNVSANPGERKLLVDSVTWKNREKIQRFADVMRQSPGLFTGLSDVFEFNYTFNDTNISDFIENCLMLHKCVVDDPFVINSIEQDMRILDLEIKKCFEQEGQCYVYDGNVAVFFEDCSLIYKRVMQEQGINCKNVQNFSHQMHSLMFNKFPREFVLFIVRTFEADMTQLLSFLKRVDELGLIDVVEHLLLNRPLYIIDESQEILHPYVYKLLHKYKQPICNLDIEPKGIEKIVEYFTKHNDLDGASEVVSLLSDNGMS